MFKLTLQIADLAELESLVAALKHTAPRAITNQVEAAAAVETQAEAPKRRGRPPKSETPVPSLSESQGPALPAGSEAEVKGPSASQAPATGAPSVDDVRAALSAVVTTQSMDAGYALLEEFGVQRVSELKPEHFEAFILASQDS